MAVSSLELEWRPYCGALREGLKVSGFMLTMLDNHWEAGRKLCRSLNKSYTSYISKTHIVSDDEYSDTWNFRMTSMSIWHEHSLSRWPALSGIMYCSLLGSSTEHFNEDIVPSKSFLCNISTYRSAEILSGYNLTFADWWHCCTNWD